MLFNSIEYFVFFGIVCILHFLLPQRFRWVLLLVASYVFYMRWNPAYIVLILFSTGVDYVIGLRMAGAEDMRRRRGLLLVSLTSNLGLLFVFKYWNFFQDSFAPLVESLGGSWPLPELDLLLPVGISFYTFQTLSYTIDVYHGKLPPERHLGRFALYVAFFPQLVAGPIERARHLLPQFRTIQSFDWERICSGLQLMLWGLFKKVVIADRIAIYVDAVYGNVASHDPSSHLLATYLFAFQIYCDFSGYSDMAIGAAKVLGYDLMKNFERPYLSISMTDFWHRWHISLSTWLRDYLYIPLGGNRQGIARTYANLLTTMVLGGLWHGASWNFVIWGSLHGVLLALSRATMPTRDLLYDRIGAPGWLRFVIRAFITFHLACLGWIFFRADTLTESAGILRGFLVDDWGMPFIDPTTLSHAVIGLSILAIVQIAQERWGSLRVQLSTQPIVLRWAIWYALIFSILLLGVDGDTQFIYFQF